MKVESHRLCDDSGKPVKYMASPSHTKGLVAPAFLLMHYTAGRSFKESCAWLSRTPKIRKTGSSAHVVIRRAGEVAQLVPFDCRAWHAGESTYNYRDSDQLHQQLSHMNEHTIGIELDNAGGLHRTAVGWATYFNRIIGGDDVIVAEHKHPGSGYRAWHAYTEEQILAAYAVCEALIDAYPTIQDVLGHEDVAKGRKYDPGPAFPMERFRSWLFGRGEG